MADRPILFSAPMVRALLDRRKTQTRRTLARLAKRGQVTEFGRSDTAGYDWHFRDGGKRWHDVKHDRLKQLLPYQAGDRLWVREAVACGACAPSQPSHWAPSFWRREQGTTTNPNGLWYRADGMEPEKTITDRGRWVPGIHMPRWASRLTLPVEDVKIERLQEISEEDAIAEGVERDGPFWKHYLTPGAEYCLTASDSYRTLWNSINGASAWDANPWVVAITFRVERANIAATRSPARTLEHA